LNNNSKVNGLILLLVEEELMRRAKKINSGAKTHNIS